ncbi:MAG: ATP-binding cassette domain-containing protein [Pseudomonadota bacterium]|nr:ATP-binding cassette domain-containing protein [Pseudomonadota bacterium]
MLEVRNLTGGWGPTVVVQDLSLDLAKGETLAIIGRNGVGKSTLLELLSGRARRISGSVRLGDTDLVAAKLHRRVAHGIGHVPQEREVFNSLTVDEHLLISRRRGVWTRDKVLDLFPGLAARIGSLGGQLSGGEQQMLAIARALVGNPQVLLMDEPSEGLAPVVIEQLVGAMRALTVDKSLGILLVEQRIDIARDLADRFVVMDRGAIVHQGQIEELDRTENLAELVGLTDA